MHLLLLFFFHFPFYHFFSSSLSFFLIVSRNDRTYRKIPPSIYFFPFKLHVHLSFFFPPIYVQRFIFNLLFIHFFSFLLHPVCLVWGSICTSIVIWRSNILCFPLPWRTAPGRASVDRSRKDSNRVAVFEFHQSLYSILLLIRVYINRVSIS